MLYSRLSGTYICLDGQRCVNTTSRAMFGDIKFGLQAYLETVLGLRYPVAIGLNMADPFKIFNPRKMNLDDAHDLIPTPANAIEEEVRRNTFWIGAWRHSGLLWRRRR